MQRSDFSVGRHYRKHGVKLLSRVRKRAIVQLYVVDVFSKIFQRNAKDPLYHKASPFGLFEKTKTPPIPSIFANLFHTFCLGFKEEPR
jgi:hypothetical protein